MEKNITQWVNDFGDSLFDWAYYKTSKRELAEDLVQETFLAAVENVSKFREESSPKTWLFTILNNKIINHYKKSARQEVLMGNPESIEAKGFTDSFFDSTGSWNPNYQHMILTEDKNLLDDEDFNKIMAICLDHLPTNWRKAISYKYLIDKHPKDICQELKITLSNYWQVIHRAKLMLKKCIEINYYKLA